MGRFRGEGRCRSFPCSWTPRIVDWRACEGATVVTEARGSPAVRKQAVDRTHLRRRSGEIPVRLRSGVGDSGSGSFLGSRWSCCAAPVRLRRGGAMESRRRGGSTLAQRVRRGAGMQRGRRCGEGRAQGRARCAKIKEGRGFWACVPSVDAAAVTAMIRAGEADHANGSA